ncbi:major head protein [Stenotrophomonas phage Philippe]|uniref:Major capsid protein n=1 Tax=Stenotrophomonas phage Philippe TaxID=2859655 RepID=A0AAE8BJM9_9CAUD|nr:major head protein [Stenotrophomonas phage Philippe]QYW02276.1 major capsid protein [Stenotrophomonas phage Philippe]
MLNYNAPIDGQKSSIDGPGSDQMNAFYWLRTALIEARKEQYFGQLADVTTMPKNYGKTIKQYHYLPLLDDRNINDQGIDANGVTTANGNLYGSSRDIGKITDKLPTLTENGGRVNRVGFTRIDVEGSLFKFGFFFELTNESMIFDSDSELKSHLSREMMNGAIQLTEAVLQRDLLMAASTVIYAGAATSNATVTGEGATPSVVSYKNLRRLDRILTENRTPKQTRIITGSRYIDTKVIGATRVAYVGPEVGELLRDIKDNFDNPAFVAIQHYGDAGTLLNGEIGSIDSFRFVQVPEMLHWAGAGALATAANPGYSTSLGADDQERYDVFPILVVGDGAFTTIGFQTNGKTVNFDVITKMPGRETADRNEPYGETGFSSIKWYYGILIQRSERLGLIKTVAPQ